MICHVKNTTQKTHNKKREHTFIHFSYRGKKKSMGKKATPNACCVWNKTLMTKKPTQSEEEQHKTTLYIVHFIFSY